VKLNRIALGAVALGVAVMLAACSGGRPGNAGAAGTTDNKGALVGVAMPTKVSERWIADGNAVKSDLEKNGYKVDLEYANNDIPTQVQQINTMITKGAKVLIIASIDGGSLTDQLDAAAKAGIIAFSKSLAREIGSRGITVNVVAPGFIDTDMTRALPEEQREALLAGIALGHLGEGRDIAEAVAFLASPAAKYITGETLHVNGGMYMP